MNGAVDDELGNREGGCGHEGDQTDAQHPNLAGVELGQVDVEEGVLDGNSEGYHEEQHQDSQVLLNGHHVVDRPGVVQEGQHYRADQAQRQRNHRRVLALEVLDREVAQQVRRQVRNAQYQPIHEDVHVEPAQHEVGSKVQEGY